MRTFRGRDVRRALAAEVVAEAVGPLSPGCELFELSDDEALAGYLLEVCDTLFVESTAADQWDRSKTERAFGSWFGNEARARDLRRAGWTSQKTGKRVG